MAGAGVDGDVFAADGFEDGEGVVGCVGERGVAVDCADAEEFDVWVEGCEEDCEGVVVACVAVEPEGDWFDHVYFQFPWEWRWMCYVGVVVELEFLCDEMWRGTTRS